MTEEEALKEADEMAKTDEGDLGTGAIVLATALRACRKERDKALDNARCGWKTARASDRAREKVEKEFEEACHELGERDNIIEKLRGGGG